MNGSQINLDKTGMQRKLETEVEQMNKFTANVLGIQSEVKIPKMDIRGYAKYVLKNGTVEQKREILGCLKSRFSLVDGKISFGKIII